MYCTTGLLCSLPEGRGGFVVGLEYVCVFGKWNGVCRFRSIKLKSELQLKDSMDKIWRVNFITLR